MGLRGANLRLGWAILAFSLAKFGLEGGLFRFKGANLGFNGANSVFKGAH